MAYELPPLPYPFDALEPHIDAKTMEIHHDKQHQAYITNANNALKDYPDLAAKPVVGALDAERAHSGTFALFDYVRKRQPVGTDWRLGEPQTSKFNVAGVSCALSSHGNGVNSGPHYARFPCSVWITGRARQYLGRL